MTLMKHFLRIFPKKRIDIDQLGHKPLNHNVQPIKTIRLNTNKNDTSGKTKAVDEGNGMVDGEYPILEREIMPEKIICPDCGGITLEGLEFCDKCGGDLTNY